MSVQNEIDRISQNVASTYSALGEMGATLPESQNSDNLAQAVYSVPQGNRKPSVKDYGAVGDGKTDDIAAFQTALAENRLVYVPEGTYVLSDTLVVRPNCELELSQATHLKFSQTTGNGIELRSSATLRGNHAVIEVPYAFTGNVISADTQFDTSKTDTPPFVHYDPMWKRARYIYDVCIVKPNTYGLHESVEGENSGTGIYLSAMGKHLTEGGINYIWGAMLQGVRIAGAFTYGINIYNIDNPDDSTEDDAWNHDMRIEAVIQGCETGVNIFNCNLVRLAVVVQPSTASKYLGVDENGKELYEYTKYAKWGVRLEDCKNIDMASSFIWDWHVARDYDDTVKGESKEEYTRIAMYGNCAGLIVGDYLYHSNSIDIRKEIYTDRQSNLDNMTILQEPITRWFKPIDNLPYFSDGNGDKQLLLKEDFDICFDTDNVADFTDELARATDGNGNIYNEVGYKDETGNYDSNWNTFTNGTDYFHTGFIPVKAGDVIYGKNLSFNKASDGNCRIVLFDSSYQFVNSISSGNLMAEYNYFCVYEGTNEDFKLTIRAVDINGYEIPNNTATAYIRFQMLSDAVGENPVIAVNEEIKYSQVGVLADSIKVKAENVLDLPSSDGDDKTYIFEAVASVTASGLSFALPEGVTHSLLVEKINAGFHVVSMATLPEAAGSKAGTYALPFTHDWQGGGSAQGDLYFSTTVIDALIYIIISSDDSVELNYYDIERQSNKVTSLSSSSTDNQYPTAKAVYDSRPDLLQNDTTAADYVKGRTHWFEYEEATLFDGSITTIQNQYAMVGALGLVEGKTYTVLWNDVEYTSTAVHVPFGVGMTAIAIGNLAIAGATPNTGEPFLIGDIDVGTVGFMSPVNGTFSVKVTGEIKKYNTLDVKYLPLGSQTCVLTLASGDLGGSLFLSGSYEVSSISYDLFADILWNGGDLLVDFSKCFPGHPASLRFKASMWGYAPDSGFAVWFITNFAFDNDKLQSGDFDAIYLYFPNGSWQPPT